MAAPDLGRDGWITEERVQRLRSGDSATWHDFNERYIDFFEIALRHYLGPAFRNHQQPGELIVDAVSYFYERLRRNFREYLGERQLRSYIIGSVALFASECRRRQETESTRTESRSLEELLPDDRESSGLHNQNLKALIYALSELPPQTASALSRYYSLPKTMRLADLAQELDPSFDRYNPKAEWKARRIRDKLLLELRKHIDAYLEESSSDEVVPN